MVATFWLCWAFTKEKKMQRDAKRYLRELNDGGFSRNSSYVKGIDLTIGHQTSVTEIVCFSYIMILCKEF